MMKDLLLLLLSAALCTHNVQGMCFDEIFAETQLDDNIMSDEDPDLVDKNAFLVLYSRGCHYLLQERDIHPQFLPPPPFVYFFKYDYITVPEHIWWIKDESDIERRYPAEDCPTVYFIKKGTRRHDKPVIWNHEEDKDFKKWAWSQLKVPVTFVNNRNHSVNVNFMNTGPETTKKLRIAPGEKDTTNVHLSEHAVAYQRARFVNADVITGKMTIEYEMDEVRDAEKQRPAEDTNYVLWRNKVMTEQSQAMGTLCLSVWMNAERTLVNLKQPLIVPALTDEGYVVRKVPRDLFHMTRLYYNLGKSKRIPEPWMDGDPLINQDKVHTDWVQLAVTELNDMIKDTIQPEVEKFANVSVDLTIMQGVREFHKGNIVLPHVMNPATSAFTVLVNLGQRENQTEDEVESDHPPAWNMRLMNKDNEISSVSIRPGEMLIFEGARLINSFPDPLQSEIYSCLYAHFNPRTDWPYRREGSQSSTYFVIEYGQVVPLLPLVTEYRQPENLKTKEEL